MRQYLPNYITYYSFYFLTIIVIRKCRRCMLQTPVLYSYGDFWYGTKIVVDLTGWNFVAIYLYCCR